MGRIRTIKPEFPQSESVGRLSRDARLLFIQLWTLVDDSGRTRGNSRMIASLLYPYDSDAPMLMETWLEELEKENHIRRYQAEGGTYLEVLNFLNHQKIDRPTPSKFPPFDESSTNPRESSRCIKDQGSRIKEEDHGTVPVANGRVHDTADTRILSESVGIFGMREQADMNRLLAVHMKESGRTVEQAIHHMTGRWEEYQTRAPSLSWTYGSSHKFFMGGFWDKPETWSERPKSRSEKSKEWSAPDDDEAA